MLAASALSALGRVQESDQSIPDTVPSANAPIEVNVPPEAAIEITNVKLKATATKLYDGSFTIKNIGDRNLIAYSVTLNLYFASGPDHPLAMRVTEDGWFLNQYVLKPGESKEAVIRNSLTAKNPIKLSRVTVIPDYIEFSGEDATGANSSAVGASLKKSRDIKAELLQSYCAKLNSGESASTVAALIKSDLQNTAKKARASQIGMDQLSILLNLYGTQGLANACSEPSPSRAY